MVVMFVELLGGGRRFGGREDRKGNKYEGGGRVMRGQVYGMGRLFGHYILGLGLIKGGNYGASKRDR